jgi:hypothetical protein
VVVESFLERLVGSIPSRAGDLLAHVKEYMAGLQSGDVDRRAFLRKFTNNIGNAGGILDVIPPDTKVVTDGDFIDDVSSLVEGVDFVIGTMNSDDNLKMYDASLRVGKPVFPMTHPLVASKFFRNIMFAGLVPISFCIPRVAFGRSESFSFQSFFEERGVTHVIIKDEYGYHSGNVIPYVITPVSKLDEAAVQFERKASRLYTDDGIVIEELISGASHDVIKVHFFGDAIPGDALQYHVEMNGLDGEFKSVDASSPQLLSRVDVSIPVVDEEKVSMLESRVHRWFPFAFTSVDFIERDGLPVVIDVNSKAGSIGEVQERGGHGNPFLFFLEKASAMSSMPSILEMQRSFLETMNAWSARISSIEDISIASGEEMLGVRG